MKTIISKHKLLLLILVVLSIWATAVYATDDCTFKVQFYNNTQIKAEYLFYSVDHPFNYNRPVNMELMKEVAEILGVSLTAAAIRYAEIGQYPVAIIMSRNGKVEWSYINEYFPYKWIPAGYKLREESSAYDYFNGKEVQTCDDLIPAYTWFSEDFKCPKDVYLCEQNIVMKNYKSVLTLLWQK